MGRLARRRRAAIAPGPRLSGAARQGARRRPGSSWFRSLRSAPVLPAALAIVLGLGVLGLGALGLGVLSPSHASSGGRSGASASASLGLAGAALPADERVQAGGRTAAPGRAPASDSSSAAAARGASFGRIILPDLLIVAPRGLTSQQETRLAAIAGVRSMISFDGARITVGGKQVNAIGVNPATFRSWVPVGTASDQAIWTALDQGGFVAADNVASALGLRPGYSYRLSGAGADKLRFGSPARLAMNGVDLLVNQDLSARLGLVHQVAALISAPGVAMPALTRAVSAILGPARRWRACAASS